MARRPNPAIALDIDRLLRHFQERRADPPEYFIPGSIAEGSGVDLHVVGRLMSELFADVDLTHEGYAATDVFASLGDLSQDD